MALTCPPQIRETSYPGFPPRCGMTFGEVVSSYNTFGNFAAKRHNYMVHCQETHLPEKTCTIRDKVALLREKDLMKSLSSSSRGLLTPRWSATRSRTPSPYGMARRPRSLPGTPRASTPRGLRRNDSHDRHFKDPLEAGGYPGEHAGAGAVYEGRLAGRYSNSGLDTFAVDHIATDTFTTAFDGKRGGSLASKPPSAPPSYYGSAPGRAAATGAGAMADSYSPREPPRAGTWPAENMGAVGAGVPPLRTPALHAHAGASSVGGWRHSSDTFGKPPLQADARAASFVRLNSFLLRTHVTSLVSALAEDGWLEVWEKDRLCNQAREDSPSWSQAFFRSYMRFLDTEDVPNFVASLRSQIV